LSSPIVTDINNKTDTVLLIVLMTNKVRISECL